MKKNLATATLAGILVFGGGALAQQNVRISQDGRPERMFRPVDGATMMDRTFMRQLSVANNFEILTSRLAERRGTTTFVRQFAREMIREHTNAQNETKIVADKSSVSANGNLSPDLQSKYNWLEGLSGSRFDEAYLSIQRQAHTNASNLLKREIRKGRDEEIKGLAVKLLPGVTMHYKMLLTKRTMLGPTKMTNGM